MGSIDMGKTLPKQHPTPCQKPHWIFLVEGRFETLWQILGYEQMHSKQRWLSSFLAWSLALHSYKKCLPSALLSFQGTEVLPKFLSWSWPGQKFLPASVHAGLLSIHRINGHSTEYDLGYWGWRYIAGCIFGALQTIALRKHIFSCKELFKLPLSFLGCGPQAT